MTSGTVCKNGASLLYHRLIFKHTDKLNIISSWDNSYLIIIDVYEFAAATQCFHARPYTLGHILAAYRYDQIPPVVFRFAPTACPSLNVPNHLSSGIVASP